MPVQRPSVEATPNLTAALESRAKFFNSIGTTIDEANEVAGQDDLNDVFMTVAPPAYQVAVRADEESGENRKPVRVLSLGDCYS